MNGRGHRSVAAEVTHIFAEIKGKSVDEIRDLYGIEVRKDGSIYDLTYDLKFDTLGEWVQFNAEQDELEYEERFTYGSHDEDY